jgi:hypothetical protein
MFKLLIPVNYMDDALSWVIYRQMVRVTQTIPEKKKVERELVKCSLALIECTSRLFEFRRILASHSNADVAGRIAAFL